MPYKEAPNGYDAAERIGHLMKFTSLGHENARLVQDSIPSERAEKAVELASCDTVIDTASPEIDAAAASEQWSLSASEEEGMTQVEQDILTLRAAGATDSETAAILGISARAVSFFLRGISRV
ncbi:helix-turn-helix transcriptional regulator [Nocardia fluminea]|uniref:helix-turn-helix transcriptional regulator n=1 Tax=Nocardia fluminea TaxID=134984 RepID=UPI003654BCFE